MSIPPFRSHVPLTDAPYSTGETPSAGAPAPSVEVKWRDEKGQFVSRPLGPYESQQRQRQSATKKQDPLTMLQDGMRLIEASMAATIALVGELQRDCGYMATENVRSQAVIRESLSKLANQRNRGPRGQAIADQTVGGQSHNMGQWSNQGFLGVAQEQRTWYSARQATSATTTPGPNASNLDVELSVSVQDRRSPLIDPGCPDDHQSRSTEAAGIARGRRTSDEMPQGPL